MERYPDGYDLDYGRRPGSSRAGRSDLPITFNYGFGAVFLHPESEEVAQSGGKLAATRPLTDNQLARQSLDVGRLNIEWVDHTEDRRSRSRDHVLFNALKEAKL